MFELNRRKMLLGIAAASTAAATNNTAALPAQENPELVALGNALPSVHEEYGEALGETRRIFRETERIWPLAPEPILTFASGGKQECDVTGAGISRVAGRWRDKKGWRYGTPEVFEEQIKGDTEELARIKKFKRRRTNREQYLRKQIAEAREAIPLSRAYCNDIEHLKATSGYEAASNRLTAAREALVSHIDAIMSIEPETMEGVVIQAQALDAWGDAETFYRMLTPKAANWPQRIAASVLKQAANAA